MKIVLYGLPCAGKTYYLEQMKDVHVLSGSQELNKMCQGRFRELTKSKQQEIRVQYVEYVRSLPYEGVISDGHYSFLDEVVFTENDGELYDVFLYLYCEPSEIKKRLRTSKKNSHYTELTVARIKEWQNFEIESLRKECHKRKKDFYVISDQEQEHCKLLEFIKTIQEGFSSYGLSEIWEQIQQVKGLKNVFANPMISAETKYYVVALLQEEGYEMIAYGDGKVDLYMLEKADSGHLCIGNRLSRSLRTADVKNVTLVYDLEPYILEAKDNQQIQKDIEICKSNSGMNGSSLASAHMRLGQVMGEKIGEVIPEQNTDILVLERGGRFFGDGVYCGFGGTFYTFNPSTDQIPDMQGERIVLVDSVINTGKSIINLINQIQEESGKKDIIVVSNVIQREALSLFQDYKVFAVRVSDNSFVGKRQVRQIGKTGPDTADRLYNLIKSFES